MDHYGLPNPNAIRLPIISMARSVYGYQILRVERLFAIKQAKLSKGAILADEIGLGKTT